MPASARTGRHSPPWEPGSVPAGGGSRPPNSRTRPPPSGGWSRRVAEARQRSPPRWGAPRLARPRPQDPGPEGERPFTCSPFSLAAAVASPLTHAAR
ncbi:proline-rich protein 34-like [Cynocephalus volans]|uniref:proline-rich protein 34-like n=1 Tax=Cynocephalus volans TaxID=110931 RepID=UPI002FC64E71